MSLLKLQISHVDLPEAVVDCIGRYLHNPISEVPKAFDADVFTYLSQRDLCIPGSHLEDFPQFKWTEALVNELVSKTKMKEGLHGKIEVDEVTMSKDPVTIHRRFVLEEIPTNLFENLESHLLSLEVVVGLLIGIPPTYTAKMAPISSGSECWIPVKIGQKFWFIRILFVTHVYDIRWTVYCSDRANAIPAGKAILLRS
jgi:hypothetical protein